MGLNTWGRYSPDTPPKTCPVCGELFYRKKHKRYANGGFESLHNWNKRKTCGLRCSGKLAARRLEVIREVHRRRMAESSKELMRFAGVAEPEDQYIH